MTVRSPSSLREHMASRFDSMNFRPEKRMETVAPKRATTKSIMRQTTGLLFFASAFSHLVFDSVTDYTDGLQHGTLSASTARLDRFSTIFAGQNQVP